MNTEITFVIPSRNNLDFLKIAYDSIKRLKCCNQILILDDCSVDGSKEWLCNLKDNNVNVFRNDGPERMGIVGMFDKGILMAKTEVIMAFHADMVAAPNLDVNILKHLKEKTVVCATRVEPPLHPSGVEKITKDFGDESDKFNQTEWIKFCISTEKLNQGKTTSGMFAPWCMYKNDFLNIGGHDNLFAPQSKEDCITGDRNIIVIENGFIKIDSVENLFERYKHLSTIRNDGKEIINFKENHIKIYSSTAKQNGMIGKSKINKIIRNKNTKELFKVRTNWGETICTKDHSLLDKKLNKVKPEDLISNNVWEPIKIGDWSRRTIVSDLNMLSTIGIKDTDGKYENVLNYNIKDIDYKGNNVDLINICEFLGFFVAEGSTTTDSNTYSVCNSDKVLLDYMIEKSKSLFKIDSNDYVTSKKENNNDVYTYRKQNKYIHTFLRLLVGTNSETKKVPDFIYNIPKCYQEAFLYGYLLGDGYLGSLIYRQKQSECFSVDKRLMFNKKLFHLLTWKSTSKSSLLTCGINYLLRKNFKIKTRISFAKEKGIKGVYNISTTEHYSEPILEITPLGIKDCHVYDLEIKNDHTFIDAMGLFGLHNSDLFNRFKLNGYNLLQSWDALVYHFTCRGSRFNKYSGGDTGKNSKEWMFTTTKNGRNFIRKWGHFIKHDDYMLPIIPHKYDIGYVIKNCSYDVLSFVEPWSSNVYIEDRSLMVKYISDEQQNTPMSMKDRVKHTSDKKSNDILITFDGERLNQYSADLLQMFPEIISQTGSIGKFELDIFNVKIDKMDTYEKELIISKK